MKEDIEEIIRAIKDVYQRDTFTMGELADILAASGYKSNEIRLFVRYAIENNQMGRVTYKNLGRKIPKQNSFVILRPKPKPKPPVI